MKRNHKFIFLTTLGLLALTACGSQGGSSTSTSSAGGDSSSTPSEEGKVPSDSLFVKKVENADENFFTGMDLSSLLSLEKGGTKFYNYKGEEEDLLKVVADNGVNLARVRIWNDPFDADGNGYGGGNSDINTALEIGKRATKYGVGLLANFHYSDFWADPARQTAPKAWKNMTVDQKAEALYTYTVESLTKLKQANVKVPMVQVGNETNGFTIAGEKGIANFAKLVNKGYDAVKAVYPDALVAVHFTNPEKRNYDYVCEQLESNNVKYDVFGSSYYPFFHGTLSNLKAQLRKAVERGKKVMVLETQYAFTSEDTDQCGNQFSESSNYEKDYPISIAGQANNYRNVCDTVASLGKGVGIGVCYWEGAWITASPQRLDEDNTAHWTRLEALWSQYGSGWASKYAYQYDKEAPQPSEWGHYSAGTVVDNMAFFDRYGKPLESLKVFNLIRYGNTDVPKYLDGALPAKLESKVNDEFTLPAKADGVFNDESTKAFDVVWEDTDINDIPVDELYLQGPGTYTIEGTITDNGKSFKTTCALTLTAANYVLNGDFEKGAEHWTVTNLKDDQFEGGNYYALITNQNSNNPISGKWDIHAFTQAKELEFKVEQELAAFASDLTLKFKYSATGGAKNEITKETAANYMDLYAYILEDGVEIVKVPGYVTAWGNIYSFDASDVQVKAGKTYVVGVYAKLNIEGSNPEFWIDVDDINLYE